MESNEPHVEKRATHRGDEPTPRELGGAITSIRKDIEGIAAAFPQKNGKPDFSGHCADHEYRIEKDKVYASYKVEATKKVIGAVVGLALLAFGTGLIEYAKKLLGI